MLHICRQTIGTRHHCINNNINMIFGWQTALPGTCFWLAVVKEPGERRQACSSRQHHRMRMFPQLPGAEQQVAVESGIVVRAPMAAAAPSIAAPLLHQPCLVLPLAVHCVAKGHQESGGQGTGPTFLWPLTKAKNLCFPSTCTFQI